MYNNPNLDIVIINAYTKFGKLLLIFSQDIGRNEIMMDGMTVRRNDGMKLWWTE